MVPGWNVLLFFFFPALGLCIGDQDDSVRVSTEVTSLPKVCIHSFAGAERTAEEPDWLIYDLVLLYEHRRMVRVSERGFGHCRGRWR